MEFTVQCKVKQTQLNI